MRLHPWGTPATQSPRERTLQIPLRFVDSPEDPGRADQDRRGAAGSDGQACGSREPERGPTRLAAARTAHMEPRRGVRHRPNARARLFPSPTAKPLSAPVYSRRDRLGWSVRVQMLECCCRNVRCGEWRSCAISRRQGPTVSRFRGPSMISLESARVSRQARAERAVGGRRVPPSSSHWAPPTLSTPRRQFVYKKRSTPFDLFRTARM